jgi:hypothetical protein|tara:strand:+ start:290 stop:538 length:249 start_codon:yes stop_codon:yes gene_type:complete
MYKIKNKLSGNTQIMNEKEKDVFFSHSKEQVSNWDKYGKRNMYEDYEVKEVTYLDKIPEIVFWISFMILGFLSFRLYLQLNF